MATKNGKNYSAALEKIDRNRTYDRATAAKLLKETAYAKFDETIELHIRTTLDPRKADQQLRGTVLLPHGTGKKVRILVFAEGEDAQVAEEAGADYVGGEDLAEKIQGGWMDFDVAIATPPMMRVVGRLGRVLGPRGLMPSPKAGTVVSADDLPRVIEETRQGRVEFRLDKTANIHVGIGKASFSEEAIVENLDALFDTIKANRPAGAKGQVIKRATLTSTMGPGIRVDAN